MSSLSHAYLRGVDLAVRIGGAYLCGECAVLKAGPTGGDARSGVQLPVDARCMECGGEVGNVERYTIPFTKRGRRGLFARILNEV